MGQIAEMPMTDNRLDAVDLLYMECPEKWSTRDKALDTDHARSWSFQPSALQKIARMQVEYMSVYVQVLIMPSC